MRKPKVKVLIPAKINLTLDVTNGEGGFHNVKSLVASINLYDAITVYKRKDDKITLTEKGIKAGCEITKNNAYKCAEYLIKEYNLTGVDIVVNKKIPVGAGLGGSSADIAGVIKAFEDLFKIKIDRKKTADKLGSDVFYMLEGGYAILSGRGNDVEFLSLDKTLYVNLITSPKQVSAKESYLAFDRLNKPSNSATEKALSTIINGGDFYQFLSNDLESASISILPEIEMNLKLIEKADAKLMTGSGSAVYGIYKDAKTRNKEFKRLNRLGVSVIKTNTI